MSSSKYDTEQWELSGYLSWKPKRRVSECGYCKGCGKVGGGFKDIDGARTCPECHGTGNILINPDTPEPVVPPDLSEHMRRAWWDFHNTEDEQ